MSDPLYTFRPEGVRLTGEPVAWRISGRFGWTYQEEPPYESQRGRIAEPLYIPPPDHREVMFQALEALDMACQFYGEVGGADTHWGRWDAAATALRAALGEKE